MQVSITIKLNIDPESWTMNYGVEGAAAIREDVKAHVTNSLRDFYGPGHLDVLLPDE
ncbi:hypothetical protein [Nocardia sp. NPDC057030]|uniref:hypothetical protein n=1 Tax=unclassified Nocardia TaxID=2637762 RepID=UPI0036416EBC